MKAISDLFNKIEKKLKKLKSAVFKVFENYFIFQGQLLTYTQPHASLFYAILRKIAPKKPVPSLSCLFITYYQVST